MELKAKEPAHAGLAPLGQSITDLMVKDSFVFTNLKGCGIDEVETWRRGSLAIHNPPEQKDRIR